MDEIHKITTVDVHVSGEPLRVITGGFPEVFGQTILEKRRYAKERYDHLRTALMWEPRGHPDMYGCVLVPPSHPEADFGVLFLHNEGFSTMCGHGVIGLVTVLLEQNIFPIGEPETSVRLETPSGLVTARASVKGRRVRSVAFRNVPSFVLALDQVVEVPRVGAVRYDLAFGGAYYAFCQCTDLGVVLDPDKAHHLIDLGMAIKQAIVGSTRIRHPVEEDLGFLYGTIIVGPATGSDADFRQVCVFADGALDRCPTGTGVSAHLALLSARGKMEGGGSLTFESILGTCFSGRVVERIAFEGVPAIIPEVEGRAYLTGRHEFVIDLEDPLQTGFRLY